METIPNTPRVWYYPASHAISATMKLLLLILLVASCAMAQTNTSRRATESAKPSESTKKERWVNPALYAADPAWRAITNQIATVRSNSLPLSEKINQLNQTIDAKIKAKQPFDVEQAEVAKLGKQFKPYMDKLYDLNFKKFEIQHAIDLKAAKK